MKAGSEVASKDHPQELVDDEYQWAEEETGRTGEPRGPWYLLNIAKVARWIVAEKAKVDRANVERKRQASGDERGP